jgi:hypothetical protein
MLERGDREATLVGTMLLAFDGHTGEAKISGLARLVGESNIEDVEAYATAGHA